VVSAWRGLLPVRPLGNTAEVGLALQASWRSEEWGAEGDAINASGLAQGDWPYAGEPGKKGFPASPNTGSLMRADRYGQFRPVVSGLDRPTTFELIGNTAFVVTITGKVLKITGLNRSNTGR
jgi:hypothetical protein